jgi:hypothetical protein
MLVNRFKSNERVIELGSNSRKHQKEATGNNKKEENQRQVQGKEKSSSRREHRLCRSTHHWVSGLLVGLHGEGR